MTLLVCFLFSICWTGDRTPSPQVKSPKAGSDVTQSPGDKPEDTAGQDLIGPKLEDHGRGTAGPHDGREDDQGYDPCRSEGLLHFVIRDFSKMPEQLHSEQTYIRNLPWLVVVQLCHKLHVLCYSNYNYILIIII